MMSNFWLACLRSVRKQKFFFVLNLTGLSVGLAAFLIIHTYIKNEESYDDFHASGKDIYRVALELRKPGGAVDFRAATNYPRTGPAMLEQFPEVESYCRLFRKYHGGIVQTESVSFREDNVWYGDSSFFNIFSFPLISGEAGKIRFPQMAFLEEQVALRYFGSRDPVGQTISVGSMDGREEFEVAGVFRCPPNSHIQIDFLFSYESLISLYGSSANTSWGWYDFYTYVKLRTGTDPAALERKFPGLIDRNGGDRLGSERVSFFLQALRDIHLNSHLTLEAQENNDHSLLMIMRAIALAILIIACINYTNMASVQTLTRSKEAGVRKVLGSSRLQLIAQFLMETFVVTGLAAILAAAIVGVSLSGFNALTGNMLGWHHFIDVPGLYTVVILLVVTTFASGMYPALLLSSFRPVVSLKGFARGSGAGAYLRKSMVVAQFLAAFVLLTGTFIAIRQVRFMKSLDPGISLQDVLLLKTPDIIEDGHAYYDALRTFKASLSAYHSFESVSYASEAPGEKVGWFAGGRLLNADLQNSTVFFQVSMDEDFVSTYKIKLLAGKNFSQDRGLEEGHVIVNQTALDALGLADPEMAIDQRVLIGGDTLSIIGVLGNYHHESPKAPFRPTVYRYTIPQELRYIAIRYSGEPSAAVSVARKIYARSFPGVPFEYSLMEDRYNGQFEREQVFYRTFQLFAALAIFIALLGLSGLAAFSIVRRTREISIRKILGSDSRRIIQSLVLDFVRLVALGNVLGIPVAVVFMGRWLEQFTSRTPFSVMPFLLAFAVCTILAILIIVVHALKVVNINPAQTLKNE